MNIVAAGISALFGSAFLAVGIIVPYYPSILGLDSVQSALSTEQAKARSAVYKLLIDPNSAKFFAVHEVKIDAARYVCGSVDSKDRNGAYAGERAFVYDDRSDSAVIDDGGVIARPHARFAPCPVPEAVKPGAALVDLGGVNKVAKAVPKSDIRVFSGLPASGAGGGGPGAGESMQQSLTRLGSSGAGSNSNEGSAAEDSPAKPTTAMTDEKEWRGDRPPAAWPVFPADDPLSKSSPALTNTEAIELAAEIEQRWKRFESKKSAVHPSAGEIEEALRGLLLIKQQSPEFPRAWALFVALRKIDRAATTLAKR